MKSQTMRMRALTLMLSGFIGHIVFGVINSILVIRALGESGIGVYVLIRPALAFLTTLTGLGNHKIRPALVISILLLLVARPFSIYLLHEPGAYLPLVFIAPLIIITSFSQKLEAFSQHLDNTIPAALTTLLSQAVKIIASLYFINRFADYGPSWVIGGLILAFWIAEAVFVSGTALLFGLYKKRMAVPFFSRSLNCEKKGASCDAPINVMVAITELLEPIIVMQLFFGIGLPSEISRFLYGALSGFTMPILLMPIFFTQALSKLAKVMIAGKEINEIRRLFGIFMTSVFCVCGFYTLIILLYPTEITSLYFNTSTGSQYITHLAPFILLFFFQQVMVSFLSAMGESRQAILPILAASIVRMLLLFLLLPNLHINIFGLVHAISAYHVIATVWILRKTCSLLKIKKLRIFPFFLIFLITALTGLIVRGHHSSFLPAPFLIFFNIFIMAAIFFPLTRLLLKNQSR